MEGQIAFNIWQPLRDISDWRLKAGVDINYKVQQSCRMDQPKEDLETKQLIAKDLCYYKVLFNNLFFIRTQHWVNSEYELVKLTETDQGRGLKKIAYQRLWTTKLAKHHMMA